MELYTIGFTQKTAETFFGLLKENGIESLIDIRLNNKSQLAGFAKGKDLRFFLKELCDIQYYYAPEFAPTTELLNDWKKERISWEEYEKIYEKLMVKRKAEILFTDRYLGTAKEKMCFLCSESTPENCHRRLLANYLKTHVSELFNAEVKHL